MNKTGWKGSLQKNPLPFLLFELWANGSDGRLSLTEGSQKKILHFVEGKIAVDCDTLEEQSFQRFISESDSVDKSFSARISSFAEQQKISWIKACLHLEVLAPNELWLQMQNHFFSGLLFWFDSSEGTYSFDPNHPVDRTKTYCLLSTLDVILHGTRQMKNLELIHGHLPDRDSDLIVLFPRHLPQLQLRPCENYLLQLISSLPHTKDIFEKSELGLKETERTLFLFLSLGLFSLTKSQGDREDGKNIQPEELDAILKAFNQKCAHIFKYIDKEIGPVSMNILEKTLEEKISALSPLFRKANLLADGRIDLQILPTSGGMLSSSGSQRALLNGLNEILAAEVLAVRKILGEEHEAVIVRNLKKIGT